MRRLPGSSARFRRGASERVIETPLPSREASPLPLFLSALILSPLFCLLLSSPLTPLRSAPPRSVPLHYFPAPPTPHAPYPACPYEEPATTALVVAQLSLYSHGFSVSQKQFPLFLAQLGRSVIPDTHRQSILPVHILFALVVTSGRPPPRWCSRVPMTRCSMSSAAPTALALLAALLLAYGPATLGAEARTLQGILDDAQASHYLVDAWRTRAWFSPL